jgi:hypothetical protein
MKKYVLVFTFSYLVLIAALWAAEVFLDFDSVGGLNIAALLVANFIAARQFTRDQNRRPTPAETKSYSLLALASIWCISLAILLVVLEFVFGYGVVSVFLENTIPSMEGKLLLFAIYLLISAITYLAIRWSFSWFAKRTLAA